jgi:xanthine dehydrogenase accessory factor
MALITADGQFHGWIGGGCTRPTVEREAAHALAERRPRLICLAPGPERDPRPGVLTLPMTCHSGGTVEVYLDPVIAAPRLLLFGRSPIITALAGLARVVGDRVDVADPDARPDEVPGAHRVFTSLDAPELAGPGASIVIASMGDFDEDAVVAALRLSPAYVGVVASRRRFALLLDTLRARGVSAIELARIANPAGLDLGAREAGEVALSIYAQLVARRNGVAVVVERDAAAVVEGDAAPVAPGVAPTAVVAAPPRRASLPMVARPAAPAAASPDAAIDPICHMTVAIATARHVATWDDRSWYFCCAGCKTKFLAEPTRYVPATPRDLAR